MYAGKKYQLPKLLSDCQRVLQTTITADNVCVMLNQAIVFEELELINKSVEFIGLNAKSVLASNAFKNLSREGLYYVVSYDGLQVDETFIYQACLKWAENKLKSNLSMTENATDLELRQTLGEVLYRIRFPSMTLGEFARLAGISALLTCSEKSSIYYYIATEDHYALTFDWKPRPAENMLDRFTSVITNDWGANQAQAI